jgi:hypothetical protein
VHFVGSGSVTKAPVQGTYAQGTVVQLTAAPAGGWSFSGWSGDGVGSGTTRQVTVTGNMAVTATFAQNVQNQYTLTVNVVGSGSVTKVPDQATYTVGTVVQLTAAPAVGWSFSGWSGGLSGSANPASITVSGNMAVTATFVQSQFTLTVVSAQGNPSPSVGAHGYSSGASVTCSVSSPVTVGGTVWACVGWTGTGSVQSSGSGLSTSFSISADSSITWVWQSSTVQNQYTLTVVSDRGSPSPSVGSHSYSSGSYVTCSVTSPVTVGGTVWLCSGWTGSGSVPSSGTGLSVAFSISQDSTIVWNWKVAQAQPQLKLTVVSAHGSPDPAVGDHYYNDGQSVECSVSSSVTENGTTWACTGWTGTGSVPSGGSSNSVSFVVAQDSSVTWLWSESVSPLAPTLSGPASGAILSSSNVTLSWDGSAGVTEFQIEINGSSSEIYTVYSNSYSADFGSGAYTWRVRELSGAGFGDWSVTHSFAVSVPMVGTESYDISVVFAAVVAVALIAYAVVYLKFGLVSERRGIRRPL